MRDKFVEIGSIVTIFDRDLEEKSSYHIITGNKEQEKDLSVDSALGKALMGRRVLDIVTVKAEEEYQIEIMDIDNSNVKFTAKTVFPTTVIINNGKKNILNRNLNKSYGTRAQDIYDDCCKKFGWDYTKRGLFAPQKPLYAASATPEGYSPLFLAHSNWIDTEPRKKENVIQEQTLEERWREKYDPAFYTDTYTRVVFAKRKECAWNYVFLGVYQYKETKTVLLPDETKQYVKIYEKISDTYPLIC